LTAPAARRIKNLTRLINENCPGAVKEITLADLNGRKIAIDASMVRPGERGGAEMGGRNTRAPPPRARPRLALTPPCFPVARQPNVRRRLAPRSQAIYQFLVAVRSSDGAGPATQLTNEAGEVTRCAPRRAGGAAAAAAAGSRNCRSPGNAAAITQPTARPPPPPPSSPRHSTPSRDCSHLQGMWYRTLKFLESGIKPVYVFDGKPPTLKSGQLAKRKDAKDAATKAMEEAQEAGAWAAVAPRRRQLCGNGRVQRPVRLLAARCSPTPLAPPSSRHATPPLSRRQHRGRGALLQAHRQDGEDAH
jgi:hypothetical protein